jgi:proteasome lid subunit RPN8/RPN11
MKALWLTPAQAQAIHEHVVSELPAEACGLIGTRGIKVERVVPVSNVDPEPKYRYTMDPRQLARYLPEFDAAGLSLNYYHSHPNGGFRPSQSDINEANDPGAVYLIVGIDQHQKVSMAAWQINGVRVNSVEIYVTDAPPRLYDQALTPAQKIAILLAGAVAVAAILLLSFALLPPAPPIP